MKKLKLQKGFTLIEMLVAMSIFMIFTGILMSSYTNVIKTQKEAEDYRVMYSEARKVFDSIIVELRGGVLDYCVEYYSEDGGLKLVAKDGLTKSKIFLKEGIVKIGRGDAYENVTDLNSSAVTVSNLQFFPYPLKDPYNLQNIDEAAVQFQPKVTVFALFGKERRNGEMFEVKLQTTVSARVYNSVSTCPK